MRYAELLMENWYLLVATAVVVALAAAAAARFLKMPAAEQRGKIKKWLLWAVVEAEKELGGGTGKLKLRQVYDLFLQRFPKVAMAISFETFAAWVDEALAEMRELLQKNEAVYRMINAKEGGTDDSN